MTKEIKETIKKLSISLSDNLQHLQDVMEEVEKYYDKKLKLFKDSNFDIKKFEILDMLDEVGESLQEAIDKIEEIETEI